MVGCFSPPVCPLSYLHNGWPSSCSSKKPSQCVKFYVISEGCNSCACCCRFVSDYGPQGYNCVCQHRLIQALQHLNVGPDCVRTYPPCLLEWTANRKRAATVLHIYCFDGKRTHTHTHTHTSFFVYHRLLAVFFFPPAAVSFLCPVHSWMTGEEMAKEILQQRYILTFNL